MQVKHIKTKFRFERELNETLSKLEDSGDVIVDIKYSDSGQSNKENYTALIIYCTKAEYRELIINKILDK